jgi:hypothetical protein
MARTGLLLYTTDLVFGFICRVAGTILGGVLRMVCWYIGSGNGPGTLRLGRDHGRRDRETDVGTSICESHLVTSRALVGINHLSRCRVLVGRHPHPELWEPRCRIVRFLA